MRCQAPLGGGWQGQRGVATDPPTVSLASLPWQPRSGGPEGVQQEGGCKAGSDDGREEAQGRL